MSEKKYVVRLSEAERQSLVEVVASEKRVARRRRLYAQILLKIDEGEHGPAWTDLRAAESFDVKPITVARLRRRLVEEGPEAAICRKPQRRPSRARKLDEAGESELLAIAQGEPPEGRTRWTLSLLGDRLIELNVVDTISHETVRRALKKTT